MKTYGLRLLKTGLSPAEHETMTLEQLRATRLEALLDGEMVERALPRPGSQGVAEVTASPTLDHMAAALDMPISSIRAYCSGRNTPRMTVHEMVRFANSIGLTVEELASVVRNSRAARTES